LSLPGRLVEFWLCARRHHEIVEGDAPHRTRNHDDHAPVEGLVVHGVEAATQEQQLLRVLRQVAKVLGVAQGLHIQLVN
jgi:hypothetical protein